MKQFIRNYSLILCLLWIAEGQCQNADVIIKINRDTINCEIEKLKKDFIVFSVRGIVDTIPIDSVHFVNKQYWIDPKYYNELNSVSYPPMRYSVVIHTDSIGTEKLYEEIKNWFAGIFNTPYDGIKMSNKDTGVILAMGTRHYSHSGRDVAINHGKSFESEVRFKIKVECKENRYKVEMFDFIDSDLGLLTDQPMKYSDKRPHEYYFSFPLEIQDIYDDFFNKQWTYCKSDIRMFATSMIQSLDYHTRDLQRQLNEKDDW